MVFSAISAGAAGADAAVDDNPDAACHCCYFIVSTTLSTTVFFLFSKSNAAGVCLCVCCWQTEYLMLARIFRCNANIRIHLTLQ